MPLKERIKKPEYTALFVTFFAGIAVHLFTLTNVIHNYDDISAAPIGFGTGITSGRWLLEILNRFLTKIGGAYNLTYLNGLCFIILIALATFFLVSVLEFKSRLLASLTGISFIVFPTAVSILFFRFTSHIYGMAILFSVLAVYVLGKFRFSFLLSAAFMALSLAIYQGFFPISVSLFVLLLIRKILEEDARNGKTYFIKGLCYCGVVILGLLIYIATLKLFLNVYDCELSGYQGIGDTSSYTLSNIPMLLFQALKSFLLMPIRDYGSVANITSLRIAYCILELLTVALGLICCLRKKPSLSKLLVLLLCCTAFPFAVNLIALMAPQAEIYTLVVYSFVSLLWLPLILMDVLSKEGAVAIKTVRIAAVVLVSFIILSYSYNANVNYRLMYYASRQTENYMSSMVAQIRMSEGFTSDKPWVFIGELNDPLLEKRWELLARYGGNVTAEYLLSCYSANDWIRIYYGYSPPPGHRRRSGGNKSHKRICRNALLAIAGFNKDN